MSSCYKQYISTASGTRIIGNIVDASDAFQRKPSLLFAVIVRVPLSMLRAGQTKREHFVVSGSLDFPVTGSPIESAVHD
jgi:hypothetical protein